MISRTVSVLCAALLAAAPAAAGTLSCHTTQAWRLDTGGMVPHPPDFYGLAATAALTADPEAGTLSAGGDIIDGLRLRSRPDTATGADLVFSTDDGAMLFRARYLEGTIPFFLIDAYEIYVGTCEE